MNPLLRISLLIGPFSQEYLMLYPYQSLSPAARRRDVDVLSVLMCPVIRRLGSPRQTDLKTPSGTGEKRDKRTEMLRTAANLNVITVFAGN